VTQLLGFSGSYDPRDVTFLLQAIEQPLISVDEKEVLLQRGHAHYSELLSPEYEPTAQHLAHYHQAVAANGPRLARDVLVLARQISERVKGEIVLVSLARAGTPIGVLLKRALEHCYRRQASHFSVSIIAGRGIDEAALDLIRGCPGASDESIVFVDGWTGKGVIGTALRRAVSAYNASRGAQVDPTLHVITDLCGSTLAAATTDDYLIPSSLLGATVSGLISRSILNAETEAAGPLHGCRYYHELREVDLSRSFVDEITRHMPSAHVETFTRGGVADFSPERSAATSHARDLTRESARVQQATSELLSRFGVASVGLLKPGLGEATRVLLRRVPRQLVLRSADEADVQPLLGLAREKGVPCTFESNLPWRAVAFIAEV
jgi:hypothetical protein